jgi:NADH-quinone oxidoreductase subunit M
MGVAVAAVFAAAGGSSAPGVALTGAALVGLNHGISTGALFLAVGFLYDRAHAREIAAFGGLGRTMPRLATLLGIVVFSSAALPGTNGFVGEVLAIAGTFRYRHVAGAVVATTAVWSAVYLLRAYRDVVWGPPRADAARKMLDRDLDARETCALGALVAAILVLGVYPAPVLDLLEAPVGRIADGLAR